MGNKDEMFTIKVSRASRIAGVAGAIAGAIRGGKLAVCVRAIGNVATERAVLAVALATRYLADEGIYVASGIFMFDAPGDGDKIMHGVEFRVGIVAKEVKLSDLLGSPEFQAVMEETVAELEKLLEEDTPEEERLQDALRRMKKGPADPRAN